MRTDRAIFQKSTTKCGVFHAPDRPSDAEHNPLTTRASSATLNVQGTATGLDRDSDMRRNVPTAPLLAAQPIVGEKKNAAGEHHARKRVLLLRVDVIALS